MSDFRAVAHLEEQLGKAGWRALIDSSNTGKIKEFCDALAEAALPTEMTLAGVTYEILSFLRGEKSVKGDVMVARAKKIGAHQGKTERERLLAHQGDIPVVLQNKIAFVFTDDRHPDNPMLASIVYWGGDRWVQGWFWLGGGWGGFCRVLRRKSK